MAKAEKKEKKEKAVEQPASETDSLTKEVEAYKKLVCSLRDERDAFEEELEKSKKESDRLKKAGFDLKTQLERMQTDFANYKRRTAEQSSSAKFDAEAELIVKFIPVLDIIDKALNIITDEATADGVRMIKNQVESIFESVGVKEIPALGETFDPNIHNAVLREQTEDADMDGKITEVFQKGYQIGDKILRHSVVKVAGL